MSRIRLAVTMLLAGAALVAAPLSAQARNLGLSEAVNELVRAGLAAPPRRKVFRQRTANLGLRIDVSSVTDAMEHLDGPEAR
jgi:hypothetical protein